VLIRLSTSIERRLEEIQRILGDLGDELARGTPLIVEGQRDAATLRRLDITGDIILAKASGKTLLDVIGEVEKRGKSKVVLLLDFDKRGRESTRRLAKDFEALRISPNLTYWRGLSSLVGGDVKDIEGLSTYIQTLKTRIGKNAFVPKPDSN